MKKLFLALSAVILMTGIGAAAVIASAGGSNSLSVDASYSGKQVEISVGESLIVTLASNASTGFSWRLAENSDEVELQQSGHEYIAPKSTLLGASGKEVWTFKAIEKGTSTIRLEYSRPWEGGVAPAQTFILTVVAN